MIRFSEANAKIQALKKVAELAAFLDGKRKIYSFDLLSGWSCPFAKDCLSKAVLLASGKRKIKDGPQTKFRCFSASQEAQYTNVYNLRSNNFQDIRRIESPEMMADSIESAMPKNTGIVRIHVAGDLFNLIYFMAWVLVAKRNPHILFYAYTKSLPYWAELRDSIPYNLVLTASYGGREDAMIASHKFRSAKVVYSEQEAYDLGLEIDHDDSHAACPSLRNQDFALLIHGTQPKDSDAAVALKLLNGKGSYNRKVQV